MMKSSNKWFIKGETFRQKALKLLRDSQAGGIDLIAPALFEMETDGVIQTRVVEGRTTPEVADKTLALLDSAPVTIVTHHRCGSGRERLRVNSNSAKFMTPHTRRLPNYEGVNFGQRTRCFMMLSI
jgi:hypothetical protein